MKINRKDLVSSHNPTLTKITTESPLTIGNGELAYTADITGMQSLYSTYLAGELPLCTMSQWGWHSTPSTPAYTQEDLALTTYDFAGRTVHYASEPQPGNELVYHWLRHNPHRINLAHIGLGWEKKQLVSQQITNIQQNLDLYSGVLTSRYQVENKDCQVISACDSDSDSLLFEITSEALGDSLGILLRFPYGHHSISASNWESESAHQTHWEQTSETAGLFRRTMDDTFYTVALSATAPFNLTKLSPHSYYLLPKSTAFSLSVTFSQAGETPPPDIVENSTAYWNSFWETGAAVSFAGSTDPRATELERRVILSQYLLAVQSAGSLPPQETGLTCNSWYGKFHLEMHPWHAAWMPLWGKDDLLLRSLPWYERHLPQAQKNAASNGFIGARWPKMIGPEGIDAPSHIATLLIWQQPHLLWLLELLYQNNPTTDFAETYWHLVEQTATFMADFPHYNETSGYYELVAPLIPVQEEFDPRTTNNPTFELEYWRLGLDIALRWAKRLGKTPPPQWQVVRNALAPLPAKDGLYLAHSDCPQTFECYHKDHPSMLGVYGMIYGATADPAIVENTLHKVLEVWDFESLWGWDFALMAMTATLLSLPELAIDILLKDTAKNQYVASGNNFQRLRDDLPLYLPGNGSLLWAVALMCTGYQGNTTPHPGFPEQGWTVTWEGLTPPPKLGGELHA